MEILFNQKGMTVRDLMECTDILRDLINRRESLKKHFDSDEDIEKRFLASFDTLTNGIKLK